ncbi:hypothetical protein [Paracandidimonas soli]|uniref:Uncharacterized protein n=1 Tax=Paracandidimonas soli TaxID=1917182 RepID=A0A4R3ULJ9_9BURK|nr:hypothetical protein [Paracandidimonas soli]TCU92576.1 hypothetical protein EV686_11413 [Paracandidimonas soli]
MTINTQKLRQRAIESGDGLLRGPALAAADHIDAQAAEIERLREALEWYASMSKQMGKAALNQDSQSILALMKDFAVDYGGRARAALSGESNG